MRFFARIRNLYDYCQSHGFIATLRFVWIKCRAACARHPFGWRVAYVYNPFVATGDVVDYSRQADLVNERLHGVPELQLKRFTIDIADYYRYIEAADYAAFGEYYQGGDSGNPDHRYEKFLQHYLSLKLLELNSSDVYIDVASNTSPMKDIVRRLFGAETYSMDLKYESGINGDRIGCDAGDTGLRDGFASKLSLHCSFEHFAFGSDIRFVREAGRILRPGGRVCIVPLYLLNEYSIRQDPTLEADLSISDREGAKRVFVRDYLVDYGRFYDVEALRQRILAACKGTLNPIVYRVGNLAELNQPNVYSHFVLLLEKPAGERS